MAKEKQRVLDLGDGRRLEVPEPDYQRLRSLAAIQGWTPETWLRRCMTPAEAANAERDDWKGNPRQ